MRFDPDTVDWSATKRPGIAIRVLWNDEATGDAAVLIKMEPGATYPKHRHVREEDVFLLQGGFRDERGEYRTGEFHRFAAGSVHTPVAIEGDLACVLFTVARGGIERIE